MKYPFLWEASINLPDHTIMKNIIKDHYEKHNLFNDFFFRVSWDVLEEDLQEETFLQSYLQVFLYN